MTSSASSTDEPPDLSDLLDRVVAGDERARHRFFDLYAPLVFRFVVFTFGLDGDEADDVVQEAMVAAFGSIRSYDRSRKLTTWLFGIAKNKVTDFFRSRMRTDLDEPVRAEVPWSSVGIEDPGPFKEEGTTPTLGTEGKDAGGRTPEEIEAALGDAAAGREDVHESEQKGETSVVVTPVSTVAPPAPPSTSSGHEPYRAWAGEIAAWLATQPPETRIIARRFTHEATYEQLAQDLAEHLGKPVREDAVRQRVSRLKRDFLERFRHLLPPSRVRLPDDSSPGGAGSPGG